MDGEDDYLLLDLPGSTRTITAWVWVETAQPLPVHYLFDGRQDDVDVTGAPVDFFFSNLHRGAAVDRLFADADNITTWSDLPTARWVHLTASSNSTLSGQVCVAVLTLLVQHWSLRDLYESTWRYWKKAGVRGMSLEIPTAVFAHVLSFMLDEERNTYAACTVSPTRFRNQAFPLLFDR
jgi:hypothetical protein